MGGQGIIKQRLQPEIASNRIGVWTLGQYQWSTNLSWKFQAVRAWNSSCRGGSLTCISFLFDWDFYGFNFLFAYWFLPMLKPPRLFCSGKPSPVAPGWLLSCCMWCPALPARSLETPFCSAEPDKAVESREGVMEEGLVGGRWMMTWCKLIQFQFFKVYTPKTNMEPENGPLEKEIPIGNHHFQVPC